MDIFSLMGVDKNEIFAMLEQAKQKLDSADARLDYLVKAQARQEAINQRIAAALENLKKENENV